MEVEIRDLQNTPTEPDRIERVLRAAAEKMEAQLDTLSVVLVDDARMAELNRQLLDRFGPTDVIAFEAEQDQEGRSSEIIISVQTAGRQARDYGHSREREICLLAVHGLLHVIGYEDATEEDRREMARIQSQLMDEIYPRQ